MVDTETSTTLAAALGRARALRARPLYKVRKQASGYSGSVRWIVVQRTMLTRSAGDGSGRTVDEAGWSRVSTDGDVDERSARSHVDNLSIGAIVLLHDEDPRPYIERLAEATRAWKLSA